MHKKFIKLALKEAKTALATSELPFGAIMVRAGKVISAGQSREKGECTVTAHAETEAVRKACQKLKTTDLSDCTIYCTGEPCNMCSAAIFQAKVPKVMIGASRADLPHFFRQRSIGIDDLAADSGHKVEIIRGILKTDCIALFDQFKA